jgi:ABC-type Fe3+-hydroxamate transport system substrate-binding protein
MNEELIDELGEAMKRREKARAAIARWQEQFDDANEDIQELSARIAGEFDPEPESEPEVEVESAGAEGPYVYDNGNRIFEPVQEP